MNADSEASEFVHAPVLRDRITDLVAEVVAGDEDRGLFVDATLGGGSHSKAVLQRCPEVRVLGLDRDGDAIEAATRNLAEFGSRVVTARCRFDDLANQVAQLAAVEVVETTETVVPAQAGVDAGSGDPVIGSARGLAANDGVAAVLFDLGVSSPQFDRAERGFSYRSSAPLDMRMDDTQAYSAADVVNESSEGELERLLRRNADERYARRIAKAIVAARPVTSTGDLAELVRNAIPAPARRRGGHPAKRTFQAIRIEVNAELEVLAPALEAAISVTRPGGRVLAIAYHSGEDRIVKDVFRTATTGNCQCPMALPCGCGVVRTASRMRVVTPDAAEIEVNPRASSARLRILDIIEPITTRPGDHVG